MMDDTGLERALDASSLDLLPLLPTIEPRNYDEKTPTLVPPRPENLPPRSAPAGKQRGTSSSQPHSTTTVTGKEIESSSQISFALEFERAKTKVLAHEVQKLRQSVVAQKEALEQQHSPPPRAASRPPPHFSPPRQQSQQQHGQQQSGSQGTEQPIQLTPESQARTRLIADARNTAQRHDVHTNERIAGKAQRIFDWRDPEFIRQQVIMETNLAMIKYRVGGGGHGQGQGQGRGRGGGGGRKRGRRRGNQGGNSPSDNLSRNLQNMLREQKWSSTGGGTTATTIPDYNVTTDPHSVGWTRTRTFKQSPYARMVQDTNSSLPSDFSDLPRPRRNDELAMQVQAQIAAERVSAATDAVAACQERRDRERVRAGHSDLGYGDGARPSTPAQQIEAEIELFRVIVLREGLLGMAASIAAEVVAGDAMKLGKPRTEMVEEHDFLSRLETKLPRGESGGGGGGGGGFLQGNSRNSGQMESQLTLLTVLDQLRCTTVRAVEALITWQKRRLEVEAKKTVKEGGGGWGASVLNPAGDDELEERRSNNKRLVPERIPFVWDGVNYMLKMATDLDFLDSVRPLRRTLGYPLIRNPFVTPFSLDQLPPDPGPPAPLLPLAANSSSADLKAASGGRTVDSVRLFRASVAILEEEAAFVYGGIGGSSGGGGDSAMLPDWNQGVGQKQLANPRDTRNILRSGLGIDQEGREVSDTGGERGGTRRGGGGLKRELLRQGAGGVGFGGKSLAYTHRTTTTTTSSNTTRKQFKLHPQDYSAVRRKTGLTRQDISSLVVYSVPPAGVKLALEALRTLLHPYCDQRALASSAAQQQQHSSSIKTASTTSSSASGAVVLPLPRAMDLEWSSLRRLAMDREFLLRCMLQFPEAVPIRPKEKRRAMMGYLNDPTFDPDVVVRQSESASKVVAWVRRVILSGMRAEKGGHLGGGDFKSGVLVSEIDSNAGANGGAMQPTHPKANNTWGYDDDAADDEGGDDEEGGGVQFRRLRSEITKLKSSLRKSGILSEDEEDDERRRERRQGGGSDGEGEAGKERMTWSRRRRLRSRGGGGKRRKQGQHTLLRTSMRIPREDVIIRVVQRDDNDDEGENSVAPPRTPSDDTIYVVLTVSMRYDDGWLIVTAHEPGGYASCTIQLHPTYVAILIGTTLSDLSDLPSNDQRDRRLEPILRMLRGSHAPRGPNGDEPVQLLLRFHFPRSLLTGIRRLPIRMDHLNMAALSSLDSGGNTTGHGGTKSQQVKQHVANVALRIELVDGSDVFRRSPWSSSSSSGNATSSLESQSGVTCHDGGVVVFGWIQSHDCIPARERQQATEGEAAGGRKDPLQTSDRHHPMILVITKRELGLLFSHKDHLLRQGDVRAQKELARVILDRLRVCISLDSRASATHPLFRLDVDRGIPLALKNDVLSIPRAPSSSVRGSVRVRLTGRVLEGGSAVVFRLRPTELSSSSSSLSVDLPTTSEVKLTTDEMAALAAVTTTQALRLSPALGRVLDRMFVATTTSTSTASTTTTTTSTFDIDKSLVTLQCRISDEMLTVEASVAPSGLIFTVRRIQEDGSPHPDKTKLSKIVRWDDARRLMERTGDKEKLVPEKSATLAERICTMLRLVESDGSAQLGGGVGMSGTELLGGGGRPSLLSDYRLETAMFRRMVNVTVALETAVEERGDRGGGTPSPVGSITIDDSATLAQARDELRSQLSGHVSLPDDFKFTWRGKPFTRAQEYYKTIAECLPSLQLRPVAHGRMSRRPGERRRASSDLLGMPLEDIDEEEWSSGDEYVSGGGGGAGRRGKRRRGGGRRRGRGGASDTEAVGKQSRKKGKGGMVSKVKERTAKKKSMKMKKNKGLSGSKKKGKKGGQGDSTDDDDDDGGDGTTTAGGGGTTTAAEGEEGEGGEGEGGDSTASEDDFEDLEESVVEAMDAAAREVYNVRKRLSQVRRFEELDDETLGTLDEMQKENYTLLKEEALKYREERAKRKEKENGGKKKKDRGGKKKKKKKKKKKGKKGKKVPAFMRMNTSKMEELKAKKESRKKKLANAEEEKKAKDAANKKKKKARPKSAEDPDYQRLPGTVTVEAGSKQIVCTEVLAGAFLDRQSRVRIGKKRADGTLENLYWISLDPEDVFGGEDGKTLTLRRPYNDWSEAACRIYMVKGENAVEPEEEEPEGDEIKEDELNKKESFFGYEMMWGELFRVFFFLFSFFFFLFFSPFSSSISLFVPLDVFSLLFFFHYSRHHSHAGN